MNSKEFYDCKFIEDNLSFYTFIEFYENSKLIRSVLRKSGRNNIYLYKYYLYANTHISLKTKDIMWNYLMSDNVKETINLRFQLRTIYINELKKLDTSLI